MSKVAGYSVLALGVAGLGIWGMLDHAPKIEETVRGAAEEITAGAALPLDVAVSGRDVTVSGTVESEAEATALTQALEEATGRRVVRSELILPEIADPHELRVTRDADGLSAEGMVASEAARAALAKTFDTGALELRRGAVEGWDRAVEGGVAALTPLEDGTLTLSGPQLALTGTARDAAARDAALAALDQLPEGLDVTTDIALLDDGKPFAFTATKGDALTAQGKLPKGFDLGALPADGITLAEIDAPEGYGDRVRAGLTALDGLETGMLEVDAEGLRLTGTAADQAALDAAVAGLPEGAAADIALLDDGQPFAFIATKGDALTAQGKLPKGFDLGALPADGITLAEIDAPEGYGERVRAGLTALDGLETGTLEVDAEGLRLTGTAADPDARDAVLAALPEGAEVEITAPDPMPTIRWSADAGVTETSLEAATVEAALRGEEADLGAAGPAVSKLAPWLGDLERFDLTPEALDVTLAPGIDAEQVRADLEGNSGALPLTLRAPETLPADGTERTNVVTGRGEVFSGGFWLPKLDFAADKASCRSQTDAALSEGRITFLTGSAQLDTRATRTINSLSAVLRRCASVLSDGFEIGGHTDSTGDASVNQELSQARASAVVEALAARGIDPALMTAKGYGADQPIADNATEDGRAANRRTTVTWAD